MIRAFASLTQGLARSSHRQLLQNRLILRFTSSSDPTQVSLHEEVEGKIMQVIKMGAKFNSEKFDEKGRAATFEELGFDSLDSVELIVAMEEYMGVQIPNTQAEKIQTVQAAINTFFRHLNQRVANKVMDSKDDSDVQKPIQ